MSHDSDTNEMKNNRIDKEHDSLVSSVCESVAIAKMHQMCTVDTQLANQVQESKIYTRSDTLTRIFLNN